MNDTNETAQELKEKGNACVKDGNYAEAVFHYTHAIKMDTKNFSLYSNRSLAFLKMQQYYYAMEDAKQTIELKPDWAKGYFRKAEVEFATFHFLDALQSYKYALLLQPDDPSLIDAITRASQERQKDKKADDQIPWLGAGIGIILGAVIVIADQMFTSKPSLSHPIMMVIMTIGVAMIGYGIARAFRYYIKCQRKSLLEPPADLQQEDNKENDDAAETETKEVREERGPRYTKAQARQRFKKGRS